MICSKGTEGKGGAISGGGGNFRSFTGDDAYQWLQQYAEDHPEDLYKYTDPANWQQLIESGQDWHPYNDYRDNLKNYVIYGYNDINGYLRNGEEEWSDYLSEEEINERIAGVTPQIESLDWGFEKAGGLDADTTFYRVSSSGVMDDLQKGTEFRDKGYTSVSMTPDYPARWNENQYADEGYMGKVEVPKGTKFVSVDLAMNGNRIGKGDFSKPWNSQKEVMLPRGTKYKVTDIDHKNKTFTMRVIR